MASIVWVGVGLQTLGCGTHVREAPAPAADNPISLLEFLTWWRAPGEVEALQALTGIHTALYPYARTFNAVAGRSAVLQSILAERLAAREPPDLLQLNGREIRHLRKSFPDALENLDDLFDSLGLRQAVFPEVIVEATAGGHLVSMPINFHRENTLIYNKALFAAHNLTPPKTVAEMITLCGKFKAVGVTPFATAHRGWVLRIMFNAIAAGHMGSAVFRDYFTGVSEAGLPQLKESLKIFSALVQNCSNPDAGEQGFEWTNAAQTLFNGDAAMFIHGDWIKSYLTHLGWRPGIDFGLVTAPGTNGLFLYVSDSFAIPRGASNIRGARDFLAVASSPAGQAAFNSVKGSSPIRPDVPTEALDPLARATLADLEGAHIRLASPNSAILDQAILKFIGDDDLTAVTRTMADYARIAASADAP